jgi:hypothetical protein
MNRGNPAWLRLDWRYAVGRGEAPGSWCGVGAGRFRRGLPDHPLGHRWLRPGQEDHSARVHCRSGARQRRGAGGVLHRTARVAEAAAGSPPAPSQARQPSQDDHRRGVRDLGHDELGFHVERRRVVRAGADERSGERRVVGRRVVEQRVAECCVLGWRIVRVGVLELGVEPPRRTSPQRQRLGHDHDPLSAGQTASASERSCCSSEAIRSATRR